MLAEGELGEYSGESAVVIGIIPFGFVALAAFGFFVYISGASLPSKWVRWDLDSFRADGIPFSELPLLSPGCRSTRPSIYVDGVHQYASTSIPKNKLTKKKNTFGEEGDDAHSETQFGILLTHERELRES